MRLDHDGAMGRARRGIAAPGTVIRQRLERRGEAGLLMILITVLAFNVIGDGIRDSLGKEVRRG